MMLCNVHLLFPLLYNLSYIFLAFVGIPYFLVIFILRWYFSAQALNFDNVFEKDNNLFWLRFEINFIYYFITVFWSVNCLKLRYLSTYLTRFILNKNLCVYYEILIWKYTFRPTRSRFFWVQIELLVKNK